jgi:transcriptional regulator of acetoin/glycerol metabolism
MKKDNRAVVPAGPTLHQQILNAMPMTALIVDEDVRVLDANATASQELGVDCKRMLYRHTGEFFSCAHAAEAHEGCGHSACCEHCLIRKSVREACQGQRTVQLRTKVKRIRAEGMGEQNYLMTAVPLDANGGGKQILLMFEDTGKLLRLITGLRQRGTNDRVVGS